MVRWIFILLLVLVGISIYVAHRRDTSGNGATIGAAASSSSVDNTNAALQVLANGCTPPQAIAQGDGPVQSDAVGAMTPFQRADAVLKPLAGFSINARVLSTKTYGSDREAKYAPIDLALGWGRMREDAVLSALDISQSSRWYHYRWSNQPPIAPDEIVRSSANMHMIPSNDAVADALEGVDADDRIRIDGWLVQVEANDGWRWRSSLSREDSGDGACEVIYVCSVAKQ
jgi:hypothetical protein